MEPRQFPLRPAQGVCYSATGSCYRPGLCSCYISLLRTISSCYFQSSEYRHALEKATATRRILTIVIVITVITLGESRGLVITVITLGESRGLSKEVDDKVNCDSHAL